jgi:hypothetical protein
MHVCDVCRRVCHGCRRSHACMSRMPAESCMHVTYAGVYVTYAGVVITCIISMVDALGVCAHMNACIHAGIHVFMLACMYTYIHTYIHEYTLACLHKCMYTSTAARVRHRPSLHAVTRSPCVQRWSPLCSCHDNVSRVTAPETLLVTSSLREVAAWS